MLGQIVIDVVQLMHSIENVLRGQLKPPRSVGVQLPGGVYHALLGGSSPAYEPGSYRARESSRGQPLGNLGELVRAKAGVSVLVLLDLLGEIAREIDGDGRGYRNSIRTDQC